MQIANEVPQSVKNSDYGCANCLWAGAECKDGSKYRPSAKRPCDSYAYYD